MMKDVCKTINDRGAIATADYLELDRSNQYRARLPYKIVGSSSSPPSRSDMTSMSFFRIDATWDMGMDNE